MAKGLSVALLLLAAAACASASRGLLQQATCGTGCKTCVSDSTSGGVRCIECNTGLKLMRDGTCSCSLGQWNNAGTCEDCGLGNFCANALKTACSTLGGVADGWTTLGLRSTSKAQCVNMAGYYITGTGETEACSGDSYSTGLKRQVACTPCPPGMVVTGDDRTSAAACVVPAGYYLKTPGQVAPCPRGEYRTADDPTITSCDKCNVDGVTTADVGSALAADCNVLEAGWYATGLTGSQVTGAALCPQKFYCPGGAATTQADGTADAPTAGLNLCPNSKWTQGLGASSPNACMVPPGYGTDSNGDVDKCPSGTYREGWTHVADDTPGAPCLLCRTGEAGTLGVAGTTDMSSADNIGFAKYTTTTSTNSEQAPEAEELAPGSRQGSCYLVGGQALYASGASFRVAICNGNKYGVAGGADGKTFGVSINPCRDCPSNMETTGYAESASNSGGFDTPLACRNKAGFGYNGRSATPCPEGTYAGEHTNSPCLPCEYGYTSAPQSSSCALAPGYYLDGAVVKICPVGSWSAGVDATGCTSCDPAGSTTAAEGAGSDAECTLCKAGYATADCTQCAAGVAGTGAGATYSLGGVAGASLTCQACPAMSSGYAFAGYDYYLPKAIADAGATSPGECYAQFAQTDVDDVGYIATSLSGAGESATHEAAGGTHAAKLTHCLDTGCANNANCMFATFTYAADVANDVCTLYLASGTGDLVAAFKAAPSGDIVSGAGAKVEAMATGKYTFWKVDTSKLTTVADADATSKANCLERCDGDATCAGVTYNSATFGTSCARIIVSTSDPAKRSLTRAVPGTKMDLL